MKKLLLITVILACNAGLAFGGLVISEILQNPACVTDSNGEWFEVYNDGNTAIDLDGYTIKDEGIDSHIISGSVVVNPGEYALLGANGDPLLNGGLTMDYAYGAGWYLSNSGDEIVILDTDLVEVARVEYDGGPLWPDPTGASMYFIGGLNNDAVNDGTQWATEDTYNFGCGDFGTPGEARAGTVSNTSSTWDAMKALYR